MDVPQEIQEKDTRVHDFFRRHRFDIGDSFFDAFSGLGSFYVGAFVVICTGILSPSYFSYLAPRAAAMWIGMFGIKNLFNRERPRDEPAIDVTPGFPSGHSATSAFLALEFSAILPSLAALFFSATVIVALGRVYLGAHYPTDVVAGVIWGIGFSLLA